MYMYMYTCIIVSQLLQEIRDNFLRLIDILNEAQENFAVTKDVDMCYSFGNVKQ